MRLTLFFSNYLRCALPLVTTMTLTKDCLTRANPLNLLGAFQSTAVILVSVTQAGVTCARGTLRS